MITLRLSLHSNLRGPGFWKLNISFLTELEYINQIETTIQETYDEHKNDENDKAKSARKIAETGQTTRNICGTNNYQIIKKT